MFRSSVISIAVAFCVAATNALAAQRVQPIQTITRFEGSALGQIDTVILYRVAAPNREDTEMTFLHKAAPGGLEEKIDVVDAHQVRQAVIISVGADCLLSSAAIFRTPQDVFLITAQRVASPTTSQSESSVMNIHTFRLRQNEVAGNSAVVFAELGSPRRTKEMCEAGEVKSALNEAGRDLH